MTQRSPRLDQYARYVHARLVIGSEVGRRVSLYGCCCGKARFRTPLSNCVELNIRIPLPAEHVKIRRPM